MTTELKAVIFDFGGDAVESDHPWHRVERGEITLEAARESIMMLGREQGL
jgi:hypothetical protein